MDRDETKPERGARRTSMIYRDSGYFSEAARELIALVRTFNWSDTARDSTAVA